MLVACAWLSSIGPSFGSRRRARPVLCHGMRYEEECTAVRGVQEDDEVMMYDEDGDGVTRSYTGFIAMCNAIEPSE